MAVSATYRKYQSAGIMGSVSLRSQTNTQHCLKSWKFIFFSITIIIILLLLIIIIIIIRRRLIGPDPRYSRTNQDGQSHKPCFHCRTVG
ncbi:hypothetical protein INR49_020938 [Caranx melampygus]|nr:hypothetical protein INR49_020938 [Caranx melampygus]